MIIDKQNNTKGVVSFLMFAVSVAGFSSDMKTPWAFEYQPKVDLKKDTVSTLETVSHTTFFCVLFFSFVFFTL